MPYLLIFGEEIVALSGAMTSMGDNTFLWLELENKQ